MGGEREKSVKSGFRVFECGSERQRTYIQAPLASTNQLFPFYFLFLLPFPLSLPQQESKRVSQNAQERRSARQGEEVSANLVRAREVVLAPDRLVAVVVGEETVASGEGCLETGNELKIDTERAHGGGNVSGVL